MIPLRQKFTSKERDTESNLDYFGARYFSGPQGRFSSPDPENRGGIPQDPQSWNAYAYARNNPLLYTDPTGEAYVICDEKGKNCSNPQEFLPRDENVRYNPNGTIDAINGDGSATRVGSYYEVGDYQDATGSLLMFAGLARLAVGGAVALIDRAALAFERNIGRLAGSEAGTLNFGSDSLPIPKVTDKKLANLVRG